MVFFIAPSWAGSSPLHSQRGSPTPASPPTADRAGSSPGLARQHEALVVEAVVVVVAHGGQLPREADAAHLVHLPLECRDHRGQLTKVLLAHRLSLLHFASSASVLKLSTPAWACQASSSSGSGLAGIFQLSSAKPQLGHSSRLGLGVLHTFDQCFSGLCAMMWRRTSRGAFEVVPYSGSSPGGQLQ